MTNDELKILIKKLEAGEAALSVALQVSLAKQLLRANHRVQAARRAGFSDAVDK
jgi:hypothetical protein